MSHLKKSILVLFASVLAGSFTFGAGNAQTNFFGFSGPEVYPIDTFIGQLQSADLDGDGLNDLIIVNNSRAKINLLYNQTGKPKQTEASKGTRELNELPPDARFRIDSIASEKR